MRLGELARKLFARCHGLVVLCLGIVYLRLGRSKLRFGRRSLPGKLSGAGVVGSLAVGELFFARRDCRGGAIKPRLTAAQLGRSVFKLGCSVIKLGPAVGELRFSIRLLRFVICTLLIELLLSFGFHFIKTSRRKAALFYTLRNFIYFRLISVASRRLIGRTRH